jgi:aryl-alcohol dehydrogenase-like predicted oxidoreductase
MMEYVRLGNSDLSVSRLALGAVQFGWTVDKEAAQKIIFRALDRGINLIDTAHIYGDGLSEEYVGSAVKSVRNDLVLATKGGHFQSGGPTLKNLRAELETSLRRLDTDRIDLYQVHFAIGQGVAMEELVETLTEMQASGKVRYVGASNFYAWQLCRVHELCSNRGRPDLVSIQSHYSMIERDIESELIPYCEQTGTALLPYYPLAGGLLAGRYRRGEEPAPETRAGQLGWARKFLFYYATEENFDRIQRLDAFAIRRGRSLAELAIAWLLTRPAVCSVIVGASRPEHVESNTRACDWRLSAEELEEIGSILGDHDTTVRYPRRLWWERF